MIDVPNGNKDLYTGAALGEKQGQSRFFHFRAA